MPLILRSIEPINIARGTLPLDVPSELECCTSRTLAHIMLQLSSLARQSEDLFADLHYQCCRSFLRASHLEKRIEIVKTKIIQLNPIAEEVSLQDINLRKPFKSHDLKDQQVVDRGSRPTAITEIYNRADPAPALDKLNIFREDGRDSMKFYTDPNYFVELWCLEVTKNAENQVKKQKQKIKHSVPEKMRTIRQPKSHHGALDKHSFSLQRKSSKLDKSHITLPQAMTSCSNPNAMFLHRNSAGHMTKHNDIISEHGTMQRSRNDYSYNVEIKNLKDRNNLSSESMRSIMRPDFHYDNGQTLPRMFAHSSNLSNMNYNGNTGNIQNDLQKFQNGDKKYNGETRISTIVKQDNNLIEDKNNYDMKPETRSVYNEFRNPLIPITSALATISPYSYYKNISDPEVNDLPLPPPPFCLPQDNQNISRDSIPSPPPILSISNNSIGSPIVFPSPPAHLKNRSHDNDNIYNFKNTPSGTGLSSSPADGVLAALASLEAVEESLAEEASMLTLDANKETTDSINNCITEKQLNYHTPNTKLRDTRSDLLSAIREGIQLRKVEERRQKSERKQQRSKSGHPLDVQSIMEAAFEIRRKMMEQEDSEEEEEPANWSE